MALIEGPTDTLPTHKPGFVVVARGSKRMVELVGGARLTLGERLFGGYSQYYNVDIGVKNLSFPKLVCPSAQPGLHFEVLIHLAMKIVDPARAVAHGLAEPAQFLAQSVRRATDSSGTFSVDKVAEVKTAIERAILAIAVDPAIQIIDASAEVSPDSRSLDLLRKIGEENIVLKADAAQARVTKARRDEIVRLLDSPDELLAQSIVTNDDTFRAALAMKLDQYSNDRRQQIELLKTLIESKVIEPHDVHERFGGILDMALAALKPVSLTKPALSSDRQITAAKE